MRKLRQRGSLLKITKLKNAGAKIQNQAIWFKTRALGQWKEKRVYNIYIMKRFGSGKIILIKTLSIL